MTIALPRLRQKPSIITLADRARDAGDWEAAARLYRKALARNPRNPPIWVQYGHALKESGRLAEAEAAYRRAIAYDPRDADAHLQLGHALKLQGEGEQAELAYLRACALDPSLSHPPIALREFGWGRAQLVELRRALAADDPSIDTALSESQPGEAITSHVGPVAAVDVVDPLTEVAFDPVFYLARYPDIREAKLDPFLHYTSQGWKEGRDPNPYFSTQFYLDQNPDVKAAGIDPFHHYLTRGRLEGRSGSPQYWVRGPWRTPFRINVNNPPIRLPVATGRNAGACTRIKDKIAVHIHAFYLDRLPHILAKVEMISDDVDVFISTDENTKASAISIELRKYRFGERTLIRIVPNRGRDIAPFLIAFNDIFSNYKYLLHLHTKKTVQSPEIGDLWFHHLVNHLLRDATYIQAILGLLDAEPSCGLIIPLPPQEIAFLCNWGENYHIACALSARLNIPPPAQSRRLTFPAGNMFWCRTAALRRLFDAGLTYDTFPAEPIPEDGTLAHAIERILPHVAEHTGFHYRLVAPLDAGKMPPRRSTVTLTVVIPALNAAEWLHHAVQSVLCQELAGHNFEIIIIDNGSTDNTARICDYYARAFQNIFHFYEPEPGAGAARNLGMKHARGKYICFLDADDVLEITAIQHLLHLAEKTQSELVTSQLCTFTESQVNPPVPVFTDGVLDMRKILSSNYSPTLGRQERQNIEEMFGDFGPCAKVYATSFLRDNKILFPTGTNFEDNFFIYNSYLSASRIAFLARPTYFYRKYVTEAGKTQSTSFSHNAMSDQIAVLNRIVDLVTPNFNPFIRGLILQKLVTKLAWEAPVHSDVPTRIIESGPQISRFLDRVDVSTILAGWSGDASDRDALLRLCNVLGVNVCATQSTAMA